MALLLAGGQMALISYLALYCQDQLLASVVPDPSARAVAAGGYLAVCQLGGAFSRVFCGLLSDRVFAGRRTVVLAMGAVMSALMSLVVAGLGPDTPAAMLTLVVFASGAAAMGWSGLYLALAAEMAGPAYAATSVGVNLTLMQCGTVSGAPLFGFVVDLSGSYQTAWLALGGLYVVASFMAALAMRGEKRGLSASS